MSSLYPSFNPSVQPAVSLPTFSRRPKFTVNQEETSPYPKYTAPVRTATPEEPKLLPTYTPPQPPAIAMPTPDMAAIPEPNVDPGTVGVDRPRTVEGMPVGVGSPQSPYERAQALYRSAVDAPIHGNRKGSALYGAATAASEAAKSGSVGQAAGAAVGGAIAGIFNKKLYPKFQHDSQVAEAGKDMSVEAALDKNRRDAELQDAEKQLRLAEADKARNPPPPPPHYDTVGGRHGTIDAQGVFHPATDEQGQALPPDLEKPIEMLGSDGVSKVLGRVNPQSGKAEPILGADGKEVKVGYTERRGEDGLTDNERKNFENLKLNREQQERLARTRLAWDQKKAGMDQEMDKAKMQMSADQFAQRYPGAGKPPIPLSGLVKTANNSTTSTVVVDVSDLIDDASKKGYQIDYEK